MKHLYSFLLLFFISSSIYSQATDFITGLNNPRDIIIDGEILYFAESDASSIKKVDLSLPNPQTELVTNGVFLVSALALKGTELYFSQSNSQNRISKIDVSDPNATPVVVYENFSSVSDLVFYGDDLYIAQFGMDRIVKLDTSIMNPAVIEVLVGFETPNALELIGDELFISTWGEDKISKIDLNNPTPVVVDVITNLLLPVGLTSRGNELYIAEAGQSIGEDRISKIDITSSNPVRETVVSGLYNPTKGLDIYDDVLYIAENFKLSKFGLPPLLSNGNFNFVNVSVLPNPMDNFFEVAGLINPVKYKIINLSGAILKEGFVSNNEKITVENLSSGSYFLILDNSKIIKIIKE